MRSTAIVAAMNEEEFIEPCLSAIYPFASQIVVVTNFDTDYDGRHWPPDSTVERVLKFDDVDKKISVLSHRGLYDETIQRNWAMDCVLALYRTSRLRFRPHGKRLSDIHDLIQQTDWFWVVDADEIYDPQTIPDALAFVARTRHEAVLVRGHNFFKTWNYRIDPETDDFCQIGFLRPGRRFHNRRHLYFPRPVGWLGRLSPRISHYLSDLYCRQMRMPAAVAHFYHGSYVGDEERIRRKLLKSSHMPVLAPVLESWIAHTWRTWTPAARNFAFPPHETAWRHVDYLPTSSLPKSITTANWPDDWIERE